MLIIILLIRLFNLCMENVSMKLSHIRICKTKMIALAFYCSKCWFFHYNFNINISTQLNSIILEYISINFPPEGRYPENTHPDRYKTTGAAWQIRVPDCLLTCQNAPMMNFPSASMRSFRTIVICPVQTGTASWRAFDFHEFGPAESQVPVNPASPETSLVSRTSSDADLCRDSCLSLSLRTAKTASGGSTFWPMRPAAAPPRAEARRGR